MLTGEVIPVMELLSSMKSHSVPEEIDVSYYYMTIMYISSILILVVFIFLSCILFSISYK